MPSPAPLAGCARAFVLVWLLGWTAGTLAFDCLLGWSLVYQFRALTFPTADGVVTRSEVLVGRDSDGDPSYHLDIAYDYEVDGRRYTGTRYSRAQVGVSSKAWHKVRDELPVGAAVQIRYDPDDPTQALLRAGPAGTDLMLLWFLTPFNLIMVGGWVFYRQAGRPAFDPADPRTFTTAPTGVRVTLPGAGRAGWFAGCLLPVTFAGVFAWGFGCGMNPPVWLAGPLYLAAVALAAWVASFHPRTVLEVDDRRRVLRLFFGRARVEVRFAAVRAVAVTREEKTDADGDPADRYHLDLLTDAPNVAPSIRLASYGSAEPAERLAGWLRARVGGPAG